MGKKVLVTGGTGYLGKRMVSAFLADKEYSEVVVYSRDEGKQQDMAEVMMSEKLKFVVGDIKDFELLFEACQGCDEVVHAAALKRVGNSELFPEQYVYTNIIGTISLIKACEFAKVKKAVFVSTDKAVAPVNMYGATKLCGEKIFLRSNAKSKETRYSVVRYGNVLGSSGSVIHRWQRQRISGKKPKVVEDAGRFWLPVAKAVDIIKCALDLMKGGEVFVSKSPSFTIRELFYVLYKHEDYAKGCLGVGEKDAEILLHRNEHGACFDAGDVFVLVSDAGNAAALEFWKERLGETGGKARDYTALEESLIDVEKLEEFVEDALSG